MTPTPARLHALLQRQHDTARRLLELLDREQAALSGNRLQDLEMILAAKQQYLAELEADSRECLAAAPDKPALIRMLHGADPQGTLGLERQWRQLETLLRQCQDQNSVNGKVIHLGQRRTRQALSILRSGEPGTAACYTPTGTAGTGGASRTLGKV
jgi:flagellar biosynthesis/type III secretory pathway chaperone